jgi:hypothetical protein
MRSHATLVIVAAALLLGPSAERPALAKSALYEIAARCPCPGPTVRTFWASKDERLACVDGVLDDLRTQGWPDELLVRDRAREEKSRCGDPRFRCDGTRARRCPGRMLCEVLDANCDPAGATGTCVARSKHWRSCRSDPYPVCGCDGKTYPNDCRLRRARVTMASARECAVGCGGAERTPCGVDEFCWALSTCDGADARGICLSVGLPSCESEVSGLPVCGCDGQTYPSICALAATGVALKSHEACAGE